MNSSKCETVDVSLAERSYEIQIGTGNLTGAGDLIQQTAEPIHVVIITDANVDAHHGKPLVDSCVAAGMRVSYRPVPPGESSKSVDQLNQLWNWLLSEGTDRSSVVVALGGGVVGDLAGFVAASFARGLRFFQIPTTLLAQVDSSVGGKVGINLPGAKNMVGAFWQPLGVLIDTSVLETLDAREYRAGLAEVVKYGAILDESFFSFLESRIEAIQNREPDVLRKIIRRSCELKAEIVENDERETSGRRALLNYGHTFAHGFEAIAGYGSILHGEAVAMGMVCASRLAESLGRVTSQETDRLIQLLSRLELPTTVPDLPLEDVFQVMAKDKKVERGVMRYVLPHRIGLVDVVAGVNAPLALDAMRRSQV